MAEIITKSAYARRRGRAASAVSNWIKAGQLGPPAVQPDGKIDVRLADEQLSRSLDQMRSAARASVVASDRAVSAAEKSQNDYLASRAASARIRAEREARELNAERGRYCLTEQIRAEFGRGIAEHLIDVQQSLPDLAARLGVGSEGLLELRRWWRCRCEATAQRNRLEAADYPDYAEDPDDRN